MVDLGSEGAVTNIMRINQPTIGLLALLCGACSGGAEATTPEGAEVSGGGEERSGDDEGVGVDEGDVTDTVAETAANIEPHLPVAIDDETRLDAVEADANTLVYTITLVKALPSQHEDPSALESKLRAMWVEQSCARTDTRPLLDRGGELRYVLHWQDGAPFTTFTLGVDDCE